MAQSAGEVEFARGVGFAQTPGQTPRTLGKGLPLAEGDRLTTSDGASAIIKLGDGTRMTVRPNSELILQQFKYRENAPDNSMLMQLVRGGFRAVTGLIAKASPNAARIQTATATIGVRGTEFDARLCTTDCATESARIVERARPNAMQASARVVAARGAISAVDGAGQRRRLVDGGPVYPGDLVETAPDTQAVLAFRDESRVTLGAATRFRVDNFVYDDKNAGEGRFLVSLLRGSVRALTGLIAKANNRNVAVSTATATIGVRGTGFDVTCTGPCAQEPGEGAFTVFSWLDSIVVTPQGQTAFQVLQAGQGLRITPAGITPLDAPPAIDGPRPDGVDIPPKLFSTVPIPGTDDLLFVFVHEGHVELLTRTQVLHLGRDETGFVDPNGNTDRPEFVPKAIDFDKIPRPNSRNPMLASLLNENNVQHGNTCR